MSSFLLSEILLYRDVHFDRKIFKEGEAIETPKSLINMTNAHFGSDASVTDFLSLGRGRSYNGNLRAGGDLMLDVDFPKIFRYLNFGIASFNFKLIGINKNYLLII